MQAKQPPCATENARETLGHSENFLRTPKGKIGEITRLFKHNRTVIVKDINLKTKHMKGREKDEPGQIIKIEAPIHSSNVMLFSKEQNVTSRMGHMVLEDGTRVRYLLKTGEIIDGKDKWKGRIKEKVEKEN